jgi:hypothetical protein
MREDAQTKAARLAGSGRCIVRRVADDSIVANVRGDSAMVYIVTWSPAGWSCSCAALGRCSHIRAVQLVTLEPLPVGGPGGGDRRSSSRPPEVDSLPIGGPGPDGAIVG